MISLSEKLLALSQTLTDAGIPHAFGGAIALAYSTEEPRGTQDIDINIFLQAVDCNRLVTSLPPEVGFGQAQIDEIARDDQTRAFWGKTPIDFFFSAHRFHATASERALTVPFAGRSIVVLSALDLSVFKTLFDRRKDWVDIENMIESQAVTGAQVADEVSTLLGGDDPRVERLRLLDPPK